DQVHRDRRSGERGLPRGRVEQGSGHDDPDHRGDAGRGRRPRPHAGLRAAGGQGPGGEGPGVRGADPRGGADMRAGKIGGIAAAVLLLVTARVWAADPVAVVTEIQARSGKVEVKPAGADWQSPKPLLSLRAGDQVRAAGDGRAVLVFTGGRGTQVVTAANSPFTIQAQAAEGTSDRARTVLGNVTSFLMGQQRDKAYQSLSVRSVRQPPLILAPRDTRVLP